ncbi:DUF2341 domain-containing protein [Colwellia piezophila]|uniref:DUF2341 domain-containing protein n=1 Tax=Colwellia piezophila TaxID=211668 RepID=UPI000379708E|nr:DUF2341 domain-containing protein [Colwellia piezophila]
MNWIYLSLSILTYVVSTPVFSADWWDTNWSKCREITIDNTGNTTLTNFPAYISLGYDSDMQTDFDDIRFINTTCNNNGSELDFEIESHTPGTSANIWIKIDSLPAAGTTISVYYGNASAASGENVKNTWDSNYQGVWHLGEDTEEANLDSTSNSNNGSPKKKPATSVGRIGKALDFDVDKKTYVKIDKDDSLNLTEYDDWTISLWVKPSSDFTDNKYPAMYVYGDYRASVSLAVEEGPADGRIENYLNDNSGIYSNNILNIGEWNHVVVVRTPENTYFYLNGSPDGSVVSPTIDSDYKDSYIGGYPGYEDGDLKGVIDEVRVSNLARTEDWIQQSYQLVENQDTHVSIGDEIAQGVDYNLTGRLNIDNAFEAYISTDDSVQGTLLTSGDVWQTTNELASSLVAGQDYYLHIYATDEAVHANDVAGFLGDFEITGTEHTFSNGLKTLDTNTANWSVSKTGWEDYLPVSGYGTNGVGPWGTRVDVSATAQWIWSSDNKADNVNYFSTKITAPDTTNLHLEYRFDDCSYEDGGEVLDSAGENHGTPNGTVGLYDPGKINTGLDLSNSDSTNWVRVPNESVHGLTDFTITTWIKISKQDKKNDQYIFYALGKDKHDKQIDIHLHIEDKKKKDKVHLNVAGEEEQFEVNLEFDDDEWHHLVLRRDGDKICFFIDGAEAHCSGGNADDEGEEIEIKDGEEGDDAVVIGQKQKEFGDDFDSKKAFTGQLEEFKIFNQALSENDIQQMVANENNGKNYDGSSRAPSSCSSIPNHFQIDTKDEIGLTCEPDVITIKACADDLCEVPYLAGTSTTLTVSGVVDTYSPVTFGVGESEVEVSYSYTKEGEVSLSLLDAYKCSNADPIPCKVHFHNAAFVFSTIEDQVAGVDFIGINIKAVKDENGVCTDILSGPKDVEMAMEYIAPNRSTDNKYYLSGKEIPKNPSNNVNDYEKVSLNFVTDSTADLGVNRYDDAGQVKLYALYVEPASGNNAAFTISGSSDAFWVSPHHFAVAATNGSVVLDGNTHDSNKKQVAGDNFTVSVMAQNFDNNATTNYIAQQAQLQLERTGPTNGGAEGTLTYSTNQSIISQLTNDPSYYTDATDLVFDLSGEYHFNGAMYSEVGLIRLYVRDNNYGSGVYKAEGSANFGRFIPSHFEVTNIVDGMSVGACSAGGLDIPFVYSGQMLSDEPTTGALSYVLRPSITVTAKSSICTTNSDSCTTTKNYTGDFNKLSVDSYDRIIPNTDATQPGKDLLTLVALVANFDVASLVGVDGEVTYTYSDNDNFVYVKEANSEVNEFTSDIELSLRAIIDSDLVETLDNEVDKVGIIATLNTKGKLIRFGRAQLENSYGPETSNLPQPLSVNYFENGQYTVAANDECTPYDAANMTVTNTGVSEPLPLPLPGIDAVDGEFINETPPGQTRVIELTAPGAGKTGQVAVIYDISDWLKYDWAYDDEGVDGLYNDNPRAVATFGIYRGNDRIIYQREIAK